jgi:hypothetical protein
MNDPKGTPPKAFGWGNEGDRPHSPHAGGFRLFIRVHVPVRIEARGIGNARKLQALQDAQAPRLVF